MNSNSNNGMSVAGYIETSLSMGFNIRDSLTELIDNAFDAGASQTYVHLDTENNTVYVGDNGTGMDKNKMSDAYVLFKRSNKGVEERDGKFSIGGKQGPMVLSQTKYPTNVISKTPGGDIYEVELNWPKAKETNFLQIAPHDLTIRRQETWNHYSLDDDQGTILQIRCDEKIFEELLKDATDLSPKGLKHYFGEKYYKRIQSGKFIQIEVDEITDDTIPLIDPLCLDKTPAQNVQTKTIEIWETANGEMRYYFKNGQNKMNYLDIDKNSRRHPKKIIENPSLDSTKIDTVTITSAYNNAWAPDCDNKEERVLTLGGRYMMRASKIIDKFETIYPNAGDMGMRKIIGYSRHLVECSTKIDDLLGILINKSHLKESDVDFCLNETIKFIADDFSKKLYKNHYAPKLQLAPKPVVHIPAVIESATTVLPSGQPASSSIPVAPPAREPVSIPVAPPAREPVSIPLPPPIIGTDQPSQPLLYEAFGIQLTITKDELLAIDMRSSNQIVIERINHFGKGWPLKEYLFVILQRSGRDKFLNNISIIKQTIDIMTA